MDDSQDKTGAKGLEAVEDSEMVRRIMGRQTRAPGLIDTQHTQDHYSRLTEWPAQRHGLLDQLRERYDLSDDAASAAGNMVYASSQGQQHDADESFTEARPSPSAGEAFETPKNSAPAASTPQAKFRVSRKPNSTAGKHHQHDAPEVSSQATERESRGLANESSDGANESRGLANNARRAEMSVEAGPMIESLASSPEIVTDSTPTAQPAVLRLSRKKAGKLVQKTSAPGMYERESETIADTGNVHQPVPASDAESTRPPASMTVVSQSVDDKTSESPASGRAMVRRATSTTSSDASPILSSKQSALDQQSSTKEAAPLPLRKSRTDGPTSQTSDAGDASRELSVEAGVRPSLVDAGAITSLKKMSDESLAGETSRQHVATEIKRAAIEGQAPEMLPFVKAQQVKAQQVKAQPVEAQVQTTRADDAAENIGPVSRAGASASQASTATAAEMRPASSRVQASGIVWRKSVGESSHFGVHGSSGRSVYSSNSSNSLSASASLPLTSGQVQGQATAPVQRQTGGEAHNSQAGSYDVVRRVDDGVGPAPSQAAPEVDLERITEHVSRAIFRQLSIERERRGL